MTTQFQERVQRGVRQGGQFAGTRHREAAGVSLLAPPALHSTFAPSPIPVQQGPQRSHLTPDRIRAMNNAAAMALCERFCGYRDLTRNEVVCMQWAVMRTARTEVDTGIRDSMCRINEHLAVNPNLRIDNLTDLVRSIEWAARDATPNQRASVVRATRNIVVHRNTDQGLLAHIAKEHPHPPTRQFAQQRLDPLLAARRSAAESQQAAAEEEFRKKMAFLRGG